MSSDAGASAGASTIVTGDVDAVAKKGEPARFAVPPWWQAVAELSARLDQDLALARVRSRSRGAPGTKKEERGRDPTGGGVMGDA